jgi:mRNA interferase RelE/StbE
MKYSISWTENSHKELERLPILVQRAIVKKVDEAAASPAHYFTKLVGREEYKLRVGDYRVLADIQQGKLIILVLEVGHRKNVYD